jgi:hypothetical protein
MGKKDDANRKKLIASAERIKKDRSDADRIEAANIRNERIIKARRKLSEERNKKLAKLRRTN